MARMTEFEDDDGRVWKIVATHYEDDFADEPEDEDEEIEDEEYAYDQNRRFDYDDRASNQGNYYDRYDLGANSNSFGTSGSSSSRDEGLPCACTTEWRGSHPWGYNPITGGYNAEEDRENGW